MKITPDMNVKETILRYPRAMEVFDVHRVLMCCSARLSIEQAARRYGADLAAVLRMLNQVAAR
ncbi:MAG: disulfide oxidoreductase [Gemmatimonadetes bacterium]|nr:disulfide oxidoreductase [Gemmatimonadota bacterium]